MKGHGEAPSTHLTVISSDGLAANVTPQRAGDVLWLQRDSSSPTGRPPVQLEPG